ncbi:MAG TPA: helix-hairpin-helix domain-containing protein [Bryobacteraceae bacterium]|jgi:competence ComEA-like helix-hairpin-helix protein|nr:helix-hairpin-helix domain-containing protein [Bryobacteraceae bacterium]
MRSAIVLCLSVFLAAAAWADDIILPDGKAKKLIEDTCTECHGLDQVVSNAMSADQWRATVNKMVKKGATLSPEQIDMVVDYLSVYFAPEKINVNAANAKDLQAALKLTAAEADAIVEYRKANGNFRDLASLEKVTGLDAAKIEANKEQIAF